MRPQSACRPEPPRCATGNSCRAGTALRLLCLIALFVSSTQAQDAGTASTEFYGKGTAVTVFVHDAGGNPVRSGAVVKLFRGGTIPAGQTETEQGRAELVVTELGDFTVVVAAAGYASAQKDFSIDAAGRTEVDVHLRALGANPTASPGRPLLAPKAKKAVDDGLRALSVRATSGKRRSKPPKPCSSRPDTLMPFISKASCC